MQLPRGKFALVAERSAFDLWKVIGVARRSASKRLSFDKIAKLIQCQDSRNRLFVEDGCSSLGYPLDNPLGHFAK